MNESSIRISLVGKVRYEDEITIAQAAKIIAYLNDVDDTQLRTPLNSFHGKGPERGGDVVGGGKEVTSPRAALEASGAKTNPEKIVALAAYVLQDGGETFKVDAIKVQFQRARESMPGNLARDLNSAVASGWIAESDVSGEFYLTNRVADVLENGFGAVKAGAAKTRSPQTRRARKPGATTRPAIFEAVHDFPTMIDGVPPFHKVTPQKNKMLYGLKVAKDLGIPGLDAKALVWITDHYGEAVASNNVVANFRQLQKAGHANKSADGTVYRITPIGEEFLRSLSQDGH